MGRRGRAVSPEREPSLRQRQAIERADLVPSGAEFPVGRTWVLTGGAEQSALWLACPEPRPVGPLFRCQPGEVATGAWRTACSAVPHAAALLLDRRPLECGPPQVIRIAATPVAGHAVEGLPLDGASCGLPFALSLASSIAGIPLPISVAATGALDARGHLLPVGGLAGKLEVIARHGRRIERLLVPNGKDGEHLREWQAAAEAVDWGVRSPPTLVGFVDLRSALGSVIDGARVEARIAQLLRDPVERRRVVDNLLVTAMSAGTESVANWEPVAKAMSGLLDGGVTACLADHETNTVRLLSMMAERWARRPARHTPSLQWVRDQPERLRAGIAAHLVQNATEWGEPSETEAEALGAACASDTTPGLKLGGALARLRIHAAVDDDSLRRSLDDQRRLTTAFAEQFEPWESTYGLCEWLRLASALGDVDSMRSAIDFRRRHAGAGHLYRGGSEGIVQLAGARAALTMAESASRLVGGHEDQDDFLDLDRLARLAPPRLEGSVLRCRLRAAVLSGEGVHEAWSTLLERGRAERHCAPSAAFARLDAEIAAGTAPASLSAWAGAVGLPKPFLGLANACDRYGASAGPLRAARRFAVLAFA